MMILTMSKNEIKKEVYKNCKSKVYTIKDTKFNYLNKKFSKFLDKLIYEREFLPLIATKSELRFCCKKLDSLNFNSSRFISFPVNNFILCIETNNYVIPVLFLVDSEYKDVIAGYTIVKRKDNGKLLLKCLGVNKKYPKRLLNEVNYSLKKSLKLG